MERDEEAELVRRVAGGDRAAFRHLVEAHQRPLSAFARRMLREPAQADDIVQETLLRLWTKASSYNPQSARLTTWLHNIAHNLCVDYLRRSARVQSGDQQQEVESDDDPQSSEQSRRRAARVRRALDELPERQRSALLLCHYQGLSNRDAAEILEVTVDALESLLSRGRRRLRRELETSHES